MRKELLTLVTTVCSVCLLHALSTPQAAAENARSAPANTPAASAWVQDYDELLKKYVTPKGVKYREWHADAEDMASLRAIVESIGKAKPPTERNAALAFYLNAYNAWVLHNILQKYPTKGPLEGETFFFHGKRIRLEGKKISLDTLEQKIIRPRFQEPRIHFALNCAARSCPPLAPYAFRAETLDRDLDALSRAFSRTEGAATLDKAGKKLRVSKIFDWYGEDFAAGGGVIAFINRYGKRDFDTALAVEPMEYDWSLNEA